MEEARQEKLKISNDLLDAMLVGVKTQDDSWGKEGIIILPLAPHTGSVVRFKDFFLVSTIVGF